MNCVSNAQLRYWAFFFKVKKREGKIKEENMFRWKKKTERKLKMTQWGSFLGSRLKREEQEWQEELSQGQTTLFFQTQL